MDSFTVFLLSSAVFFPLSHSRFFPITVNSQAAHALLDFEPSRKSDICFKGHELKEVPLQRGQTMLAYGEEVGVCYSCVLLAICFWNNRYEQLLPRESSSRRMASFCSIVLLSNHIWILEIGHPHSLSAYMYFRNFFRTA